MIELLVAFLEIAGEFIITFMLEVIGNILSLFIPEMQGRRYSQAAIGWFLALVGAVLGGLSVLILPNLLIRLKNHFLTPGVNPQMRVIQDIALENLHGQRVFEELLDGAFEGSGTVDRVVTAVHQQLPGGRG